jgi:hypothetical protein
MRWENQKRVVRQSNPVVFTVERASPRGKVGIDLACQPEGILPIL